MNSNPETFFSIDVETSGPIPGEYSLLTIGACLVDEPDKTFYCQLKPTTLNADPKALEVSGLSLAVLSSEGLSPEDAMTKFDAWVAQQTPTGHAPVFVGFNASFDWSFVNFYFHRFLGHNPFGFSALDIKSFYMGSAGCSWGETKSSKISAALQPTTRSTHNALQDAVFQAELFRLMREK